MQKIKKGDVVIVTAGKDKGRTGSVLSIIGDNEKVLVENVNKVKRHVKPNPNVGEQGGIVEQESPLAISNVMHYNSASKKGEKIGIKTLEDGRKVRFFKSNGESLDS